MALHRGYIFDLDGVVYAGHRPIPGARDFISKLRKKGVAIRFLSNASFRSRRTIARQLSSMGIKCTEREVINSGYAAAEYIKKRFGKCRVFVVGESDLARELERAGLRTGKRGARAVLSGLDRHMTYEKLSDALDLLRTGATFLACNSDATYPSEKKLMPGAGAMLGALERSSKRRALIIGKPNLFIMRMCLRSMGLRAGEVAVVGDRLETDILLANKAGAFSILVLTGVCSRRAAQRARGKLKPKLIVKDLRSLAGNLRL